MQSTFAAVARRFTMDVRERRRWRVDGATLLK
jgi:hypothetical protein